MSLILLNHRNQQYLDRKTQRLAHLVEIFSNLQQQIGIPSISGSKQNRRFRRALLFMGSVGVFGSTTIFVASLSWCLTALISYRSYMSEGNITLLFIATFLSIYVMIMQGVYYLSEVYCWLNYPAKIIDIYEQLTKQRKFTLGEIMNVEINGKTKILHYCFKLPGQSRIISGSYTTTSQSPFRAGDKVKILYLNAMIHIII